MTDTTSLWCEVCEERPDNGSLNLVHARPGIHAESHDMWICDVCLADFPPECQLQCTGCFEWIHPDDEHHCSSGRVDTEYLRRLASDFDDSGHHATAEDYRRCARELDELRLRLRQHAEPVSQPRPTGEPCEACYPTPRAAKFLTTTMNAEGRLDQWFLCSEHDSETRATAVWRASRPLVRAILDTLQDH